MAGMMQEARACDCGLPGACDCGQSWAAGKVDVGGCYRGAGRGLPGLASVAFAEGARCWLPGLATVSFAGGQAVGVPGLAIPARV